MGRPEYATDPRFADRSVRLKNVDALDRLLEEWTATRGPYEVMAMLQQSGIAAGVVQNVEDQYRNDRQLAARHFFEEIDHAVKGRVVATGIPLGLTATPGRTRGTGAAVGADNQYVFGELLGMSAKAIGECVAAGAIETDGAGDSHR
jgi:formyl-CoA transferase